MRIYDAEFVEALGAARDTGIAPVYFFHALPRDRSTGALTPMGFWTGDEDLTVNVEMADGGTESRFYYGGCGLSVGGIQYVCDLSDNPVSVELSQIADPVQLMIRGLDLRLAYCEIHATSWAGGVLVSRPQLSWVGVVDDAQISIPASGSSGSASLTVRDEILSHLTATNPSKSSDAHQRSRLAGDRFCEFATTVTARNVQWYKE